MCGVLNSLTHPTPPDCSVSGFCNIGRTQYVYQQQGRRYLLHIFALAESLLNIFKQLCGRFDAKGYNFNVLLSIIFIITLI